MTYPGWVSTGGKSFWLFFCLFCSEKTGNFELAIRFSTSSYWLYLSRWRIAALLLFWKGNIKNIKNIIQLDVHTG